MIETRHNTAEQNYKLLDKNIGIDLCDLGLCKTFLDMTPKSQTLVLSLVVNLSRVSQLMSGKIWRLRQGKI